MVRAHERLSVVSFTLLDDGLSRMAMRMGCDLGRLGRAPATLDGQHNVLGLAALFEEVRRARPSATIARAYHEAKMIEALALLHDHGLQDDQSDRAQVSVANRAILNHMRAYVLDHPDQEIRVDDLCAIACVSPSKLSRPFRRTEGVSIQRYVRNIRMDIACDLLAHSDLSAAQIAPRVGFARQGSFSKAFKARFGVAPRAYRAVAQGR